MCLIGKTPFGQMKLSPDLMIRNYKLLFETLSSLASRLIKKNKFKKLFKNYLAKD